MEIRLLNNPELSHTLVQISAPEIGPKEQALAQHILGFDGKIKVVIGRKSNQIKRLRVEYIHRFYTGNGKIWADTNEGSFQVSSTLVKLTENLPSDVFVRISKAEIINLDFVHHFDPSISGTVVVVFQNGQKTYVSRRYIASLKAVLQIGKQSSN